MSEYRVLLRIEGLDKSVVVMFDDLPSPVMEIRAYGGGRTVVAVSTALPSDFLAAATLVSAYAEAFELALRELV
jgi:hypothetical protein